MAVYVDDMIEVPPNAGGTGTESRLGWHWPSSCHLWADTLWELMGFARRLDLKDKWLHRSSRKGRDPFFHFDLNEPKRAAAIRLGAEPVGRAGLKEYFRRLRGESTVKES